jgi:hypothetical protein
MGRQAKLKQLKKEQNSLINKNQIKENINLDPNDFVKEMEHEGYTFKQIRRSPEVPSNKIEPQI